MIDVQHISWARHPAATQRTLTVKLVLDDVVEGLKQEKDQVVVLGGREEEPIGGKGLQEMEQLIGCHHGQALQIGGHCRGAGGRVLTEVHRFSTLKVHIGS